MNLKEMKVSLRNYYAPGNHIREIDQKKWRDEKIKNEMFGRNPGYDFDDIVFVYQDILVDENDENCFIITEGNTCIEKIILE